MNDETRKQINKHIDMLKDITVELLGLCGGEYSKYNNLDENLQKSEQGYNILDAADNLKGAANMLEEAIDFLTDAINNKK